MQITEQDKKSCLAELQAQLQDFLLDKSTLTPSITLDTEKFTRELRLDIYYQAYRLRLIEALGKDFPALEKYLGVEKFSELGLDYIAKYPSRDPSLRWLSRQFSAFVAERKETPAIIDLAEFEWAQIMAFDALEVDVIDESSLRNLDPADWMKIELDFHPSLQIIELSTPAPQLWQHLIHPEKYPEIQDPQSTTIVHWVIWRKDFKILFQPCETLEAMILSRFKQGNCLQAIFEKLSESLADNDLQQLPSKIAGYLQRWIKQGWIQALKI